MTPFTQRPLRSVASRAALALILATGAAAVLAAGEMLSGKEEVPPVTTSASGKADITVKDDRTVSGSVTTTGVEGSAAHIHLGAMGKSGPPIIPLEKAGDGKWGVPAGARLSEDQYKSYKAGDLYVNVHSAKYKDGEVRAQLKP